MNWLQTRICVQHVSTVGCKKVRHSLVGNHPAPGGFYPRSGTAIATLFFPVRFTWYIASSAARITSCAVLPCIG